MPEIVVIGSLPMETVTYAASLAKDLGKTVIVDPAPARSLPPSLLRSVDFLTPNETEAEKLSGLKINDVKGARCSILLPSAHRTPCDPSFTSTVLAPMPRIIADGFQVEALDTTAAGDAFNAALAVGLAEGRYLGETLQLANAVGALTVTRLGAQMAMPSRAEVSGFLEEMYFRSAR